MHEVPGRKHGHFRITEEVFETLDHRWGTRGIKGAGRQLDGTLNILKPILQTAVRHQAHRSGEASRIVREQPAVELLEGSSIGS